MRDAPPRSAAIGLAVPERAPLIPTKPRWLMEFNDEIQNNKLPIPEGIACYGYFHCDSHWIHGKIGGGSLLRLFHCDLDLN